MAFKIIFEECDFEENEVSLHCKSNACSQVLIQKPEENENLLLAHSIYGHNPNFPSKRTEIRLISETPS